jgi:tetratricopeptide (TPR) repeat protein
LIGWLRGDEEGKKQYLEICGQVQNSKTPGAFLWAAVATNAFEADEQCRRFVVDRAKQLAEAAPANFYRRNTLGAALYRAGEFEQAIQELEKARAGFAAEKVNDISQRYDRAIRLSITPPPEGRAQDWAFLAMANAQLALKTNQPERRAAAWDCMRKLRDAPELAQSAQQMGGSSSQPKTRNYPVAYDTLALELLYDETMSVLLKLRTPQPPPSSPPVAAAQ